MKVCDHCIEVAREIQSMTLGHPELKEVGITQLVSVNLKNRKIGLFQNEVDYRVLIPNFTPPEDIHENLQRLRADLVGFSGGNFVLSEYKLYDELKKDKNPWGVLYFLIRDRLKLEAAIRANSKKLRGHVMQVFAVRNADFSVNQKQIEIMLQNATTKSGRAKPIPSYNFYSLLSIFKERTASESAFAWKFSEHKKASTAFLVGITEL